MAEKVIKFRHQCMTCGGRGKRLTALRDDDRPRVGDLSICSRCSTIGRFVHEGDMNLLIALSPAEIERIRIDDPEVFDEMRKGLEDFRRRN